MKTKSIFKSIGSSILTLKEKTEHRTKYTYIKTGKEGRKEVLCLQLAAIDHTSDSKTSGKLCLSNNRILFFNSTQLFNQVPQKDINFKYVKRITKRHSYVLHESVCIVEITIKKVNLVPKFGGWASGQTLLFHCRKKNTDLFIDWAETLKSMPNDPQLRRNKAKELINTKRQETRANVMSRLLFKNSNKTGQDESSHNSTNKIKFRNFLRWPGDKNIPPGKATLHASRDIHRRGFTSKPDTQLADIDPNMSFSETMSGYNFSESMSGLEFSYSSYSDELTQDEFSDMDTPVSGLMRTTSVEMNHLRQQMHIKELEDQLGLLITTLESYLQQTGSSTSLASLFQNVDHSQLALILFITLWLTSVLSSYISLVLLLSLVLSIVLLATPVIKIIFTLKQQEDGEHQNEEQDGENATLHRIIACLKELDYRQHMFSNSYTWNSIVEILFWKEFSTSFLTSLFLLFVAYAAYRLSTTIVFVGMAFAWAMSFLRHDKLISEE